MTWPLIGDWRCSMGENGTEGVDSFSGLASCCCSCSKWFKSWPLLSFCFFVLIGSSDTWQLSALQLMSGPNSVWHFWALYIADNLRSYFACWEVRNWMKQKLVRDWQYSSCSFDANVRFPSRAFPPSNQNIFRIFLAFRQRIKNFH